MPNYCSNRLECKAESPQQMNAILEDLCVIPHKESNEDYLTYISEHFGFHIDSDQIYYPTFQKLMPFIHPKEHYLDTPEIEEYRYRGTKWDMLEPNLTIHEPLYFTLSFDTAWSPPDQWFRFLCDKYPTASLIMNSEEGGSNFEINQGHTAGGGFFYHESEYRSTCDECDSRLNVNYDEESGLNLCENCLPS